MRVPTKQLEEHADKQSFKPATRRFFPSIYRKAKDYYQPFIINFHFLNEEIGKTKKKYGRSTLSYVREEIINSPAIQVVRQHSPYVFELKIIPFSDLQKINKTEEKMNADDVVVEAENQSTEVDTENLSEDTGIEQQQLIYASQKTRSLGLDFGIAGLKIIAKYSQEILDKVLNHYQFAREHNEIPSPTGWIIRNLQQKWYTNFRPETMFKSIVEEYFRLQDLVLDNFGTIPSRQLKLDFSYKKTGLPAR